MSMSLTFQLRKNNVDIGPLIDMYQCSPLREYLKDQPEIRDRMAIAKVDEWTAAEISQLPYCLVPVLEGNMPEEGDEDEQYILRHWIELQGIFRWILWSQDIQEVDDDVRVIIKWS